jgi:hypoxanthine-DNA glycosylase
MKLGLKPVVNDVSKILILGTLPGDDSIQKQEYYANPRNQFWSILEKVYEQPIGDHYEERLRFLGNKDLALWDVLQSAEREGSSDRNIKNGRPNDFKGLFAAYPGLKAIAFNGVEAANLFSRLVLRRQAIPRLNNLRQLYLPSTSVMPGRYVLLLEQKIQKWRVISEAERST